MKNIHPQYKIRNRHLLNEFCKFWNGKEISFIFFPRNSKKPKGSNRLIEYRDFQQNSKRMGVLDIKRFKTLKTEIFWNEIKLLASLPQTKTRSQQPLKKSTPDVSIMKMKKDTFFFQKSYEKSPQNLRSTAKAIEFKHRNNKSEPKIPYNQPNCSRKTIFRRKNKNLCIIARQETRFRRFTSKWNAFL